MRRLVIAAASAGLVALAGAVAQGAADASVEAVDPAQLKIDVNRCEHELKNLRVKFAEKKEHWDPKSGAWQWNGEARGTAWYSGTPGGEAKIEFDDSISPWINGAAPIIRKQFTIAFDGKFGLDFEKAVGDRTAVKEVHYGTVTAERSPLLTQYSLTTTGWGFSLYGLEDWTEGARLSQAIGATRPSGSKPTTYTKTAFQGTPCIEMTRYDSRGGGERINLDPARAYAVLRHEYFDGSGVVSSSFIVTSFIKAAPRIFFPKEAKWEAGNMPAAKLGSPFLRETYAASEAVANDPSFTDDEFGIKWPAGSYVDDKVTGRAYTVKPSDGAAQKKLDGVGDITNNATTAPSAPDNASKRP